MTSVPTTIAFYLPQFHPIPENNGWYGEGFTEWHNVANAKPLFPGHYQPRLPQDLGYYDLRVPEVRAQQARIARTYGIDAFCYYHYWFEGHRPFRRVMDEILESGTPAMPFCLAWANENWSKHWDASNHEVLLKQSYSLDDDIRHGEFLLRAMQHPLYLRVGGRPVLFIYRIQALPDPTGTLGRWRDMWAREGLGDVEIIKFETHGDHQPPTNYGADSSAQFLPHGTHDLVRHIHVPGAHPDNVIFHYDDVVDAYLALDPPDWRRYECVLPGWDNTARRGDGKSTVIHASTPERYGEWLEKVRERTVGDGLILINAWNEWAEGAHLEPDARFGRAYLEATARALGVDTGAPERRSLTSSEVGADGQKSDVPDRYVELYSDALDVQTRLQRRLSRLEASFERQLEFTRRESRLEVDQLRREAAVLVREIDRLRAQLARQPQSPELAAARSGTSTT
ncbi:glycoside hydrolase family 99-like domain-containing protein [Skermania piniformis]|uniref:Glycoside hydrolase family 99-like domain-containing protein n=1 Tax=Skermania pinensis TaxID=39122 RepID=A0ABX8S558_9ACTN|nr:glycoside hydrolase family 99-like domain-containing protein [Skermania piniformis]QXQ12978.1 glycoside hydrolase family 99-like domain-containing protein [Skermania piniformis]